MFYRISNEKKEELDIAADKLKEVIKKFIKDPVRIPVNISDEDGTPMFTGDLISMSNYKCPINLVVLIEDYLVKTLLGITEIDPKILIDGKVPCRFYVMDKENQVLPYLNVLGAKCKVITNIKQ